MKKNNKEGHQTGWFNFFEEEKPSAEVIHVFYTIRLQLINDTMKVRRVGHNKCEVTQKNSHANRYKRRLENKAPHL